MSVLESSIDSNGLFCRQLVPDDFPLLVLHTLFADPNVEPIVFLYQFLVESGKFFEFEHTLTSIDSL